MESSVNALGVDRMLCAAFTGYRPGKMTSTFNGDNIVSYVSDLVRPAIIELYGKGVRLFFSGMAEGFDLWAAAEVLKLHAEGYCPDVSVGAVIPYKNQSYGYSPDSKQLFRKIVSEASYVEILSENYYKECFHRRNDYLVDNSSVMIAYYDGRSGGTQYTVKRARRVGIPVLNICVGDPELF